MCPFGVRKNINIFIFNIHLRVEIYSVRFNVRYADIDYLFYFCVWHILNLSFGKILDLFKYIYGMVSKILLQHRNS